MRAHCITQILYVLKCLIKFNKCLVFVLFFFIFSSSLFIPTLFDTPPPHLVFTTIKMGES